MNIELIVQHLLFCSAVMTVLSLCYLFAAKRLFRMQAAHWRFLPWWFLGIGFLTPFKPHFGKTLIAVQSAAQSGNTLSAPVARPSGWALLFFVWLAGTAVSLFRLVRGELDMKRSIRRLGTPLTDPQSTALNLVCAELDIEAPVRAVRLPFLQSPMLTGLFQPVILLPADQEYTILELSLVFRHELTHFRRGDLCFRLIWLLVRCVHWFNPAVGRIMRFTDTECELACDEQAMAGQTPEQRTVYCELIVQTAARCRNGFRAGIATNFSCSGAALHRRIRSVLTAKRGRRIASLVVLMLLLTVLTGKLFGTGKDRVRAEREPDMTEYTAAPAGTTATAEMPALTTSVMDASFAEYAVTTSVMPQDLRTDRPNGSAAATTSAIS